MKKIFSIFIALMTFSGAGLAGGIVNNPSTISNTAIVKTHDGVKVFYKSEKAAKVKVTIYDGRNTKVFEEEVKTKSGFVRPYNLASLPAGNYRVVLEDENGRSEKIISNIKEPVKVLAAIINSRNISNKCLVTLYSKGKSDVTVRLLDKDRNELAYESSEVNGQASLLFNLENFNGALSVEVSDKTGVIKTATLN